MVGFIYSQLLSTIKKKTKGLKSGWAKENEWNGERLGSEKGVGQFKGYALSTHQERK